MSVTGKIGGSREDKGEKGKGTGGCWDFGVDGPGCREARRGLVVVEVVSWVLYIFFIGMPRCGSV